MMLPRLKITKMKCFHLRTVNIHFKIDSLQSQVFNMSAYGKPSRTSLLYLLWWRPALAWAQTVRLCLAGPPHIGSIRGPSSRLRLASWHPCWLILSVMAGGKPPGAVDLSRGYRDTVGALSCSPQAGWGPHQCLISAMGSSACGSGGRVTKWIWQVFHFMGHFLKSLLEEEISQKIKWWTGHHRYWPNKATAQEPPQSSGLAGSTE